MRQNGLLVMRKQEDAKYEKILGKTDPHGQKVELRAAATGPTGAYDTEIANHVRRKERWR